MYIPPMYIYAPIKRRPSYIRRGNSDKVISRRRPWDLNVERFTPTYEILWTDALASDTSQLRYDIDIRRSSILYAVCITGYVRPSAKRLMLSPCLSFGIHHVAVCTQQSSSGICEIVPFKRYFRCTLFWCNQGCIRRIFCFCMFPRDYLYRNFFFLEK